MFGFLNAPEISLEEQGEAILLSIGFIKGGNVQTLTGIDRRNLAHFGIDVTGSASKCELLELYFSSVGYIGGPCATGHIILNNKNSGHFCVSAAAAPSLDSWCMNLLLRNSFHTIIYMDSLIFIDLQRKVPMLILQSNRQHLKFKGQMPECHLTLPPLSDLMV